MIELNNSSSIANTSTSSIMSTSFKPKSKNGKLSSAVSAKVNDYRKNTKPLMEKRRRERINRSLEELKNLILDQTNHNPVRNHKLEKADILEMTVKHLRSLQKQKLTGVSSNVPVVNSSPATNDASLMSKFKPGFAESVQECLRFMNNTQNAQLMNNVDPVMRQRVLANLMRQFQSINSTNHLQAQLQQQQQQEASKQVTTNQQLSPRSPLNNLVCFSNPDNLRRQSVSPVSSSSCCSSSSSSSTNNTSYTMPNLNQESMDNEQSLSPGLDSANNNDACWRPW